MALLCSLGRKSFHGRKVLAAKDREKATYSNYPFQRGCVSSMLLDILRSLNYKNMHTSPSPPSFHYFPPRAHPYHKAVVAFFPFVSCKKSGTFFADLKFSTFSFGLDDSFSSLRSFLIITILIASILLPFLSSWR